MIKLLFFAEMQEVVGASTIEIDDDNLSIAQIKEKYLKAYDMDHLIAQAMFAVNEEYADEDTFVKSGDVVAFIPPVSGG